MIVVVIDTTYHGRELEIARHFQSRVLPKWPLPKRWFDWTTLGLLHVVEVEIFLP
jgi:hypothetical protein